MVLCTSTRPGFTRAGRGPCHPCGPPRARPPNPAPTPQLWNRSLLIKQEVPFSPRDSAPLPTHQRLLPQRIPFSSPAPQVVRSTPSPRNAPLPRGHGRGYPISQMRTARLRQMTFHGRTGARKDMYASAGSRALPATPAHRTHLLPSLGSLPSSQRSFARGWAELGQGRVVPGRALAAGTCSPLCVPSCAACRARTPPPRRLRGEPAPYWPAPPALGPAGLKGDAARLGARRVTPALAPPRFPAPHPSPSSVPQP